jgi:serine-type D-Ala-D-Ala carboxypeptidase
VVSAWAAVDVTVAAAIPRVTPAAVVYVAQDGLVRYSRAYGRLSPDPAAPLATTETLFDLASITKVFATTLFLQLVDAELVSLATPVVAVLPEFAGVRSLGGFEHPLTGETITYDYPPQAVDAATVTFRHLLTHTAGLADWLPLFRAPDRATALQTIYQYPFAYPPGARCAYSDMGIILLGEAITRLAGQSLREALRARLLEPLGAQHTDYRPLPAQDETGATSGSPNIAPTWICRWRRRRLQGEVDDENAARLGGIAAHAGLFSTAGEVARLGELYLNQGEYQGRHLLRPGTVQAATSYQAGNPDAPRGLGWMLRPAQPAPGLTTWGSAAFSPGAFGHTGFTGGSFWVDPERRRTYVLLTNRTYHGRESGPEGIAALHAACARAVVHALDQGE